MISDFIKLIRINQWYKNIVVFLPIIFAVKFNIPFIEAAVFGFFALCLVSSSNYIINDILDREKDKVHPEKKLRPIASGRISISSASIIAILFLALGIYISYRISYMFLIISSSIFILTSFYSLFLKDEPFVDVLMISTNFTLRALAGAYLTFTSFGNILKPTVSISPWLILCPFFLALFLALGKKYADFIVLGDKAELHKPSYRFYKLSSLESYMTISTTLLIMSYSLFSFLSIHKLLLITLPFALYGIFRYYYFIHYKPEIARNPHKMFYDIRIMIDGTLWLITVIIAILA